MRGWAMPIPPSASGLPNMDIGFPVFAGKFTDTGRKAGMPTHRRSAPMFFTCWQSQKAFHEARERGFLVISSGWIVEGGGKEIEFLRESVVFFWLEVEDGEVLVILETIGP